MTMEKNPKIHDALFKWLITSFTEEFFAHYFPEIRIGKYSFLDKEFISRYEALKESMKGDLFLAMETEIEGELRDIVIQIEHQSEKKDIGRRVYEYSCYAWLLRGKPVWSMVVYTDDAVWKKTVPASFWYAFDSRNKKQFHCFDVIKIKSEKSGGLIEKHSLLCKLLALKADDRGTDPEELVYKIYQAVSEQKDRLNEDQLLLAEQWVGAYKKISDERLDVIRKEVKMEFIATTITEHIRHQTEIQATIKGKIEGKIELLENLYIQGILPKERFEEMVEPLRKKLSEILSDAGGSGLPQNPH